MTPRSNRLAGSSSPYLLQHAHNPVNWYPWGEEAFAEARRRNVPIFVSIGYATCYWCHVMERESFESPQIAAMMNDLYVCVKVDREERPEIDDVYMAATVMMTGQGGWPMSVFVEPRALKPFWCGTYFPAQPMPGMGNRPTFPHILEALHQAWSTQREEVLEQADTLAGAVAAELGTPRPLRPLSLDTVVEASNALLRIFDRSRGGFGDAPKFPQPVYLELLLDVREAAGDDSTADATGEAVRRTLNAMMIGGLHDQIGGGFHRYCVDGGWTVPHFEKMLYDNAQLASLYARASHHFGDAWFERTARRTIAFVERELSLPNGVFTSALDAEVDGREGLNYLWHPEELAATLSAGDAAWITKVYGLDGSPNFRDPHHPHHPPAFVPRLHDRPERIARELETGEEEFTSCLDRINSLLLAARQARKQPRLDDKSITSWNAMMIAALASSGEWLSDPALIERAARAADSLFAVAWSGDRLARTVRDGRVGIDRGTLEDYAALMGAAATLARAQPSRKPHWIGLANGLLKSIREKFMDSAAGIFDVESGRSDLFLRNRSVHDGAVPSGCSVLLHALLDLEAVSGDSSCGEDAVRILSSVSGHVGPTPLGSTHALRALLRIIRAGGERAAGFSATTPRPMATTRPGASELVQVFASDDHVAIGADTPAQLTLRVKIADGWHIAASDAEGLTPLRVHIAHGTGVAAYADYPAGTAYGSPHAGLTSVLRGEFDLPVALELHGDWSGSPVLAITYQACTDTECLGPTSLELDISIDRA